MAGIAQLRLFEFFRSRAGPNRGGLSGDLSEPELFAVAADVDETLRQGFRRLYFSPRLEGVFERETGAARSRYLIMAGLVAILTHDLFLITDFTMLPDMTRIALILRLGVITPLAFVIMAALYRGLTPGLREGTEAIITLLTSAGTIYLAAESRSPYAAYYGKGLMLVVIFGNIVIRLRFWYAAASSLATLILVVLFFPGGLENSPILRIDIFLVLSSCIVFTLFANYNLERDQRRGYLLGLRDRIRRADLTANNLRLTELSHLDPLTGIPNRRELTEYLDHLAQGSRSAMVAIVMLDLDHFKLFNDLYGHPAGDVCLQRIAATLSDSLRQGGDMVARFGGEEFVVVLPGNDLQGAERTAERLRQAVQKLAIPHAGSPGMGVVTLSAGIAAAPSSDPADIQAILAAADAALYRAKSGGRNRVER